MCMSRTSAGMQLSNLHICKVETAADYTAKLLCFEEDGVATARPMYAHLVGMS